MKTNKIIILSVYTLLWLFPLLVAAQCDVLSHNSGTTTHYVGWASSVTFPLNIRHNGNQPINFATNNLLRMRLNQSITNTLNGFSAARDGYLLLGNSTVVGRLRVV